jgi:hypothetical protein
MVALEGSLQRYQGSGGIYSNVSMCLKLSATSDPVFPELKNLSREKIPM